MRTPSFPFEAVVVHLWLQSVREDSPSPPHSATVESASQAIVAHHVDAGDDCCLFYFGGCP